MLEQFVLVVALASMFADPVDPLPPDPAPRQQVKVVELIEPLATIRQSVGKDGKPVPNILATGRVLALRCINWELQAKVDCGGSHEYWIKLGGIAVPKDYHKADRAAAILSDWTAGNLVTIAVRSDDRQPLPVLFLGRNDLAQSLVRRGYAFADDLDHWVTDGMKSCEQAAEREQAGFWGNNWR